MSEPSAPYAGNPSPGGGLRGPLIPRAVWVLMLLGLILRLYRIDSAELWTDEMTAITWSAWSIPEYLRMMYEESWLHFPLSVWILKGLVACFGDGEFVYRLLGLIPGTLAIPALYCLGRTLFSREVGLVAAALLVFSPTGLFVSQEAWDYGLVLLMVIVTAHAFFRAWRTDRGRDWLVFALCGLVCFYTHIFDLYVIASLYVVYGATLVIPTQDRAARVQRWRSAVTPVLIGAVSALLFVPGIVTVFRTTGGEVAADSGLIGAGPVTSFWGPFLTTLRHFAYDRPISVYLLGVLFVLSLPAAVKRPKSWAFVTLASLCISIPLLIALSKGIQFRVRHYTFALPFVLMLMACGIVTVRQVAGLAIPRWRGWTTSSVWPSLALAALIMGGPALPALEQYYRIRAPQSDMLAYEKQGLIEPRLITPPTKIQLYSKSKVPEYRTIAALLRRNAGPGDILILDDDVPGDDTGRAVALQLNRRFGFRVPTDEFGVPLPAEYDAFGLTVMRAHTDDAFLATIEQARLPRNGMRVFRVSQRYNIEEASATIGLDYTLINVTVSRGWIKDGKTLAAYLRQHRDRTLAEDAAFKGQDALDQKDLAGAERAFRESLAIARTSRGTHGLGEILMDQKKPEEAEPLLALAAETRKDRWDYWSMLGKARMQLKRPDDALPAFEKAAEFANASPWANLDLATLCKDRKEYEKAYAAYHRLAEAVHEPGYAVDAARMLLEAKKAGQALDEARAVIAAHPDQGLAYVVACQSCEWLGRRSDAYEYLLKAQALRPKDALLASWCVKYHLMFGKVDEARALLQTALEMNPGHAELTPLQGQIANYLKAVELTRQADAIDKTGDHAEAEKRYRASVETFKTADAAYGLGTILLNQGKDEEAVPLLSFAADVHRDRWEEWYRLGKAQDKTHRTDAAIGSYEKAAALPNASVWVWLDLAKAAEAKKDWRKARAAYLELAERQQDVGYRLEAVRTRLASGEAKPALDEALALVKQYPDNGIAHLRVAQCYVWLNQRDKAYPYVVQGAALRPEDASAQVQCAQFHIAFQHNAEAAAVLEAALERHPGNAQLEALQKDLQAASPTPEGPTP